MPKESEFNTATNSYPRCFLVNNTTKFRLSLIKCQREPREDLWKFRSHIICKNITEEASSMCRTIGTIIFGVNALINTKTTMFGLRIKKESFKIFANLNL